MFAFIQKCFVHFARVSGLAVASMLLTLPSSFAVLTPIADLTQNTDAVNAIKSYLQDDPTCYGCRGVDRTSGVNLLRIVRDSDTGDYFFQGFVWANSNHPHGLAYGAPVTGDGNNIAGRGLLKVDFSFAIQFQDGQWTSQFTPITNLEGNARVEKVTQQRVLFCQDFMNNPLCWALADASFPNLRPSASMVEIDLEQVFSRTRAYFPAPNNANSSASSGADSSSSGEASSSDSKEEKQN